MRLFDWSAVRYLLVGGLNTAAGLLVIFGGKWLFGLHDVAANLIGYWFGIALSFVVNMKWTFGYRGDSLPALVRFIAVTAVAYAANLGCLLLLIAAGVDSYLAQALAVVPYTLIGYLGSRFFAFSEPCRAPVGSG